MMLWLLLACGESESVQQVTSMTDDVVETVGVQREFDQGNVLVRMTITPETVRLGDPFSLDLQVLAQSSVTVEMPPFGEALGRLSIVDYKPRESVYTDDRFDGMQYRQTYALQPNRSGQVVIPALRVGYQESDGEWQEILTDELSMTVQSILPDDADLVMQPARTKMPPILKPTEGWPWVIGGILASLVLGCLWWFRRDIAERYVPSPFEEASVCLRELEAQMAEEMDVPQWYAQLSQMVRRLLERQYHVSALEQTTPEIAETLRGLTARYPRELSDSMVSTLLTLLRQCDGVKFAGRSIAITDVKTDLDTVVRWVRALEQSISTRQQVNGETKEGTDG